MILRTDLRITLTTPYYALSYAKLHHSRCVCAHHAFTRTFARDPLSAHACMSAHTCRRWKPHRPAANTLTKFLCGQQLPGLVQASSLRPACAAQCKHACHPFHSRSTLGHHQRRSHTLTPFGACNIMKALHSSAGPTAGCYSSRHTPAGRPQGPGGATRGTVPLAATVAAILSHEQAQQARGKRTTRPESPRDKHRRHATAEKGASTHLVQPHGVAMQAEPQAQDAAAVCAGRLLC